MPIEVIDKIKPKNNGSFPIAEAVDILMPDGTRLSEFEGGVKSVNGETPDENGNIEIEISEQPSEVDITGFGEDGIITETYEDGTENTYTFVYDEETDTTTVTDSKGNVMSIKGYKTGGSDPVIGKDGFSPVVAVTETETGHSVSITDVNGTQTFEVADGADGTNGKDGKDGKDGADGADGNSPEISITYDDGHIYYNVENSDGTGSAVAIERPKNGTNGADGADGAPGADGADGVSPTIETTEIEGGHRVTITDANGTQSFDVMDGEGGEGGGLLSGNTTEITPAEAGTAIAEGKRLLIVYNDSTYGLIGFTNFTIASTLGIIVSSTVVNIGTLVNVDLVGDVESGTWSFSAAQIATEDYVATYVEDYISSALEGDY